MNIVEKLLFETDAIKVANEDSPFWYTSGMVGPYFINTHFLFGNEDEANRLLSFIDDNISKDKIPFANEITKIVVDFYNSNSVYRSVIDYFQNNLIKYESFNNSDYISGGERRDWFFSIIVAELLKKKHIFISKDLETFNVDGVIENIKDKKVSHLADLVTEASSYKRSWIPAIKKIDGKIIFTAAVVDRNQGGKEFFSNEEIDFYNLVTINDQFFVNALNNGIINSGQLELIRGFAKDPISYGKNFIMSNINFLEESLNSSNKSIQSKAKKLISENPYNFERRFLDRFCY